MTDEIVLVGRGPSVETFDWPDLPIGAVSSGVFIKQLPRRPDYWFSLDPPRFFVNPQKQWKYLDDPNVEWWDACNSSIAKHVPRGIPNPNPLFDLFRASASDNQPDDTLPNPPWDDFPNVTFWNYTKGGETAWEGKELGGNNWGNTVPFALQVLWRLGYKRVMFAGVEWSMPGWGDVRRKLNNLGKRSPLTWPQLEV